MFKTLKITVATALTAGVLFVGAGSAQASEDASCHAGLSSFGSSSSCATKPAPAPKPAPKPAPAPAPKPEPKPAPAPAPKPEYTPAPTPAPAPPRVETFQDTTPVIPGKPGHKANSSCVSTLVLTNAGVKGAESITYKVQGKTIVVAVGDKKVVTIKGLKAQVSWTSAGKSGKFTAVAPGCDKPCEVIEAPQNTTPETVVADTVPTAGESTGFGWMSMIVMMLLGAAIAPVYRRIQARRTGDATEVAAE